MSQFNRSILFTLLVATVLGGCGELTAGGARDGEVTATVTSSDSPQGTVSSSEGPTFSVSAAAVPTGRVDVTAQVSLLRADGSEVPLHRTPAAASVSIELPDSVLLARSQVQAITYAGVRLRFSSVEAHVASGVPLLGAVRVEIGGGALLVDVPVQVEVRRRGLTRVVIDLNAHTWVVLADPITRTVSATDFRSAITVHAH